MTDVFDDLAKAFKAGYDAGRSESADEIERLREALRYYANKTQEEWVNVTGADDGVVARAALEEKG